MTSDEAIQRESALQAEARSVLADLDLLPIFASYGDPHPVGSMAMGLMVSPDIAFNVLVDRVGRGTLDAAYAAFRPLVTHPRVFWLRYASQLGPFNPDGSLVEEGFYGGIHIGPPPGWPGRSTCGPCSRRVRRSSWSPGCSRHVPFIHRCAPPSWR